MKCCTKCVLPETHETVAFDKDGVCNICRQSEVKHEKIDWEERKKHLMELVNQYRGKGQYDCILPFSGGKDSTYQLWYVITQLHLRPLVVSFNHWGYRPLVQENNVRTFKLLGVDVLQFTPNWKIVKQLMLESLKQTGDFCWHCHTGVFAHTMQVAVRYKTPLVIWGEASSEYRAYHSPIEMEELNIQLFNEMINLGIDSDKMLHSLKNSIDPRDLLPFKFPSSEELQALKAKPIYLGNYINWNTKKQVSVIKEQLGWKGQDVEGIPPEYDYEKIECRWQGIRDYCKYIKRGHGRTNHLACIDIRNGDLSREKGLQLCEQYDGKRPASLDDFLQVLNISEDEFIQILCNNRVSDWGFDKNEVQPGLPVHDMDQWDRIV